MGSLLACTRKDLVRRLRDPLALAIWVAVPLLLGLLLSSLGGGPGGTPVARVYWVDHDGSFASELLTRAAAGAPVVELIEVDEAAGRARLEEGEGSALVVLPQGFGEALLRGTPAELLLVRNPAQRILPGIVEEGLEVLVEAGFYLHELLGPELAVMLDGPPPGRTSWPRPRSPPSACASSAASRRWRRACSRPCSAWSPTGRTRSRTRVLPAVSGRSSCPACSSCRCCSWPRA